MWTKCSELCASYLRHWILTILPSWATQIRFLQSYDFWIPLHICWKMEQEQYAAHKHQTEYIVQRHKDNMTIEQHEADKDCLLFGKEGPILNPICLLYCVMFCIENFASCTIREIMGQFLSLTALPVHLHMVFTYLRKRCKLEMIKKQKYY